MSKAKVLLINPWQTYDKDIESEYQSYIPYGLLCIGSISLNQNFETMVLDCLEDETKEEIGNRVRFGKSYNEVKKIIEDYKPNIVGISSSFSMFKEDAIEMAQLVKSIYPETIVILGGVTATLPEIYKPLLLETNVFDFMVRGEGELTFKDLLNNYNEDKHRIENLYTIKGISFKENGEIIETESRPFNKNLDDLPFPDLSLINIEKTLKNKYYNRWRNNPDNVKSIPIFTSRGCPYRCVFCSVHSQVGYGYRTYSIEYVLSLIKLCVKDYGITHFHFEDDNLTLDMQRAKLLFKKLKDLNITWDTPNGVRADKIDEEMIELMKDSGLKSLSIAAESGNENVRMNIVHKDLTNESIINVAKLCDDYNLPCIVFFVLGFPGETLLNINETIKFAKYLTDIFNTINMIFIANPLPGTELYKQSRLNGFIKKDLTSSDYFIAIKANQKSIINTPEFNKKIIFLTLKKELNTTKYSVHNIAQPMFWNNNKKAWSRAKSVFPRMSNRKVLWTWIEEK